MRLKWRDYPTVLTHFLAFLAGSLLIRVEASDHFPAGKFLLLPLAPSEVPDAEWDDPSPLRDYAFVQGYPGAPCLRSEKTFRLWKKAGRNQRVYLLLDRNPETLKVVSFLLRKKDIKLISANKNMVPCRVSSSEIEYAD
jgi:hypothetical protein